MPSRRVVARGFSPPQARAGESLSRWWGRAKGPGEQVSAAGGGARGGAEPGDDGGDRAVPGGGVRDAGLGGAQGRHHAAGDGRGCKTSKCLRRTHASGDPKRQSACAENVRADTTPAGRLALGALKYTYALTISGFNSAWQRDRRSPLYRPDWRHLIIAQANANLSRALHKMDRDGYTPVAVHKDAVYLVSDEPDPVAACPPSVTLGTGLGHFKVQDAAIPLETVLPAFDGTRGGIGTLLKLLKPLRTVIAERTPAGVP